MRKLPEGSIDLFVTDPPYRLVSGGCTTNGSMARSGILSQNLQAAQAGKLFMHNDIAFADWVPEAFRVLKPDAHCYIMVNARNLMKLWLACEKVGFVFQNLLVWEKGNVTPCHYYMGAYELILMFRKGKAKRINNRGTKNILKIKNLVGEKVHPTQKPVELMQILIENSSDADDCVLDPFMGSGSTGVSCIHAGRRFIGMEKDGRYFQIAQKRIKRAAEKVR